MALQALVGQMRTAELRVGRRLWYLTPVPNELLALLERYLRAMWWHREHRRRPRLQPRRLPPIRVWPWKGQYFIEERFPLGSPWRNHYFLGRFCPAIGELHLQMFVIDVFAGEILSTKDVPVRPLPANPWDWKLVLGRDTVFVHGLIIEPGSSELREVRVLSFAMPDFRPLGAWSSREEHLHGKRDLAVVGGPAPSEDDTVYLGLYVVESLAVFPYGNVRQKRTFVPSVRLDRSLGPAQFGSIDSFCEILVPGSTLSRCMLVRERVGAMPVPRPRDRNLPEGVVYGLGPQCVGQPSPRLYRYEPIDGATIRETPLWRLPMPPQPAKDHWRYDLAVMAGPPTEQVVTMTEHAEMLYVGVGPALDASEQILYSHTLDREEFRAGYAARGCCAHVEAGVARVTISHLDDTEVRVTLLEPVLEL